jgi:hypothetical protein
MLSLGLPHVLRLQLRKRRCKRVENGAPGIWPPSPHPRRANVHTPHYITANSRLLVLVLVARRPRTAELFLRSASANCRRTARLDGVTSAMDNVYIGLVK